MMSDIERAFPVTRGDWKDTEDLGMTLRDYFASQALKPLILTPQDIHSNKLLTSRDRKLIAAAEAYEFADAMMEARK